MTEDQNLDQEVELHDDENEIMEAQGHDPKNAEAQSVSSLAKADDMVKKAPARKGDQSKQDPMPRTKAGMINAAYTKLSGMKKEQLTGVLKNIMSEEFETEEDTAEYTAELNYQADFSEDLNALVESEATLSEEFRVKASTIFEAAIKSKLSEEIDRLEAKYEEELAEEIESTKSELVEKVDSYLNYVVGQWMEDNTIAIQSGLRTEIAENFMNSLKDLFEESYIDVPESKVDLVDDLADTVEELEEKLDATTAKVINMAEELEDYKRDAIIREASSDLAETQVEKLKSLVEDIDFEDEETFAQKVTTVKESYFTKKVVEGVSLDEEGTDDDVEYSASPAMNQYLSAIRKTSK